MPKDNTNENIKNGKGLEPIPNSPANNNSSGIDHESRGNSKNGIRTDRFSLNDSQGEK